MPIRLNVVLSQPASGQPRQQDLTEQVLAQLLGRPAMDLGLIGPLDAVLQTPTDQLMLDGLAGDFAILTWTDAATTTDRLQRLGIEGRRAAHRDDPRVPPGTGRRIYCLDGNAYATAAAVVDALAALLKDRQTVTVGLGMPGGGSPPRRPPAVATDGAAPAGVSAAPAAESVPPSATDSHASAAGPTAPAANTEMPAANREMPAANREAAVTSRTGGGAAPADPAVADRRATAAGQAVRSPGDVDPLDALVDDLNALDL